MPQSLSSRFFRIFLLTVLAAGVAAVPVRMAGQDAAPAAVSAQATPSAPVAADAAKTDEKAENSEKAESDAFRLEAPLIKWVAKALGISVDTAAKWSDIFNFLIIAVLIGVPLAKFMPKVIRKRGLTVRSSIEEARKSVEEAKVRLSAIESKLTGLDAEIAQIKANVEQESLQDEARIKASIVEESARIVAAAEQEIEVASQHARRGLQNYAADLAIEQAAKQLVLTPETDQALIAEFLQGVSKGGQN
jgi:F-type H+-transporting ATPase subunit b